VDLHLRKRALPGILAILALTLACDGQRISADYPRSPTDSAEQVMYNGRTIITSNGVRRGEVFGDTIGTYEAVTRFRFHPLQVRFSTALGRPLAVLNAPQGEYSIATGALVTTGSVTIVSDTAARRLVTQAARYDAARNLIEGDSAFTATAGPRTMSGVGFTADPGLFGIKCLKQCAGSLGR
jgi:LPS export ABC transporter protein LptC